MIKYKIEVECEKEPEKEVCGFVINVDGELDVLPVENKSPEPKNEFYIPAKEFLYVKKNYNIVAVYHSHAKGNSDPSDFDLKTADLVCYPFVIYSIEKNNFHVHVPEFSDANEEDVEKLKNSLNND
jgi:proteasome lid subunit RPN8/RPN11